MDRCAWCGKTNRMASGWEQEVISGQDVGQWKPLCRYCLNRRFRNPWNALIPFRKMVDQ